MNAGGPDAVLGHYAEAAVAGVAARRATWTRINLLAEAARATRALRLPDPAARVALCDRVVTAALDRCVALDPPQAPTAAQRYALSCADAPEPAFTTWEILAAEARLLAAHHDTTAPVADPGLIHTLHTSRTLLTPKISADQARAAAAIAACGRRLDVLIGPAGTGKTRTLAVLRAAWEHTHGPATVIGLAPCATAAAELGASLGIGADTLAKWAHETDPATAAEQPWALRAGQLVIVDEAAMAPTAHLDRLVAHATAAGAKVLLVGDPGQLGAVETGGAFALLIEEGHAVELDQLHRFTHDWEAAATRKLRVGDPAALETYAAHGRLHDGPREAMTETAYRAWATDTAAGRHSLLLAADRHTVAALNARARADRIRAGAIDTTRELPLHDGTTAATGDLIITRRNNRRLPRLDGNGHIRNGDHWHITAVHPDGSLDATPVGTSGQTPPTIAAVRLPADYVRDHVELGYAATVHRAQGATADTAHLVAAPGMTREALYVGLTRGRHANHAYITTDTPGAEAHATGDQPTGRQILVTVLRSPAAQTSATSELRRRQADHALALTRAGRWPAPPDAEPIRPRPFAAPHRPPPTPGMTR